MTVLIYHTRHNSVDGLGHNQQVTQRVAICSCLDKQNHLKKPMFIVHLQSWKHFVLTTVILFSYRFLHLKIICAYITATEEREELKNILYTFLSFSDFIGQGFKQMHAFHQSNSCVSPNRCTIGLFSLLYGMLSANNLHACTVFRSKISNSNLNFKIYFIICLQAAEAWVNSKRQSADFLYK